MKKKVISGLFLMLWMALLIAAMVYPQGIFPVLAASGVWVACLLTWAVIPVALAALIKNGPLWQELRVSLLKTITRKENVFISWVMRLLIVVSFACLLTLSGCGNVRHSPEVWLTVSGCPRVTPCRLDQATPRTNGDLNALLDETEAAWAVCADKVDMIIACQERNSEQTTIPAPRPQ